MSRGKAHGADRQYQVRCRDVLIFQRPELRPWASDGIDVSFDLPDTCWTFDVALSDPAGALVVAECRRTIGAVKQGDVGEFAYKVESVRRAINVPVAGIFIAKREHQVGAIKVGQFNGIEIAILEDGSAPPEFVITFLRYDRKREKRCRDFAKHLQPASLSFAGDLTLVYSRGSGASA